jgi:hypothetical protein
MKINKKKLVRQSSKLETYYTYHNKKLGEIKIRVIENFDDKGNSKGINKVELFRDDFCLPELVKEVWSKHKENQKSWLDLPFDISPLLRNEEQ